MGGHAAWRKRVAAGELAKGSGGAALRHRPRLGRKGADLALNRLGNLGGHGNPKRKATRQRNATKVHAVSHKPLLLKRQQFLKTEWVAVVIVLISGAMITIYVSFFYSATRN